MEVFISEEIVNKVLSLSAAGGRFDLGFKAECESLGKRFQTAQNLLIDAQSRQQIYRPAGQDWLKKLELVSCKADDTMDEYAYEVYRIKFQVQNRMRNMVSNFFSLSNPWVFRVKMAFKVRSVHLSLDKLYKIANDELGLRPEKLTSSTLVEHQMVEQTLPFGDYSAYVGINYEVSKVVDILLGTVKTDQNYLPVIAIVGMGGTGKTTFAQLVYNDEKVVDNFDRRIWVTVANNFEIESILFNMQQSLSGAIFEMSNIQGMVKKLREKVGGKRYLLVLDDIRSSDNKKWNELINYLQEINGERGTKILVTTRSEQVVVAMQASFVHSLQALAMDECWALFEKRAFADGGPIKTPMLVNIGRRLVQRCKGLPLLISTLGAFMYSKKDEREWLSIQESEIWGSREIEDDVQRVLMLSFNHLPSPSLKKCFAYCSLFPKDYEIVKDDFIQRWMPQGYLQPPCGSNRLMEDIGIDYFNVLLSNSFLMAVQKDEFLNITSCRMHDLVHDFALHISKDYFLSASEVRNVPELQHLSVISGEAEVKNIPRGIAQRLRTLHLPGNLLNSEVKNVPAVLHFSVRNFKGLRELQLSDNYMKKLPKSIGRLIHLRYLDVSQTDVESLPGSVCKLYNLQTLNVAGCRELDEFPRDFCRLVNLRHLYMTYPIWMPVGIGQLTSLQTLPFFVVGQDNGCRIEELGCLSNLRGELKIYDLQLVRNRVKAQKTDLSSKAHIQVLSFEWRSVREEETNNDENVLEGLQPHKNLKGLILENFQGEHFASWMMLANQMSVLNCLVKIKLVDCDKCQKMPVLGHLPCLEVVEIDGLKDLECIGVEFYGPLGDGVIVFPSLRILILRRIPKLVEWLEADIAAAVFPCLEELKMENCEKLVTAPGHFPFVKKLKIHGLNNSQALKKMSSTLLTTLESLDINAVSGSELNLVLERILVNNKFLRRVWISNCQDLWYLPNGLENLSSLSRLRLSKCPNLTCFPKGLHIPVSLESLYIEGCPKLVVASPDPDKPISLGQLTMRGFETLTTDWARLLLSLTGLRTLEIDYCCSCCSCCRCFFCCCWPSTSADAAADSKRNEEEDDGITQHHHLEYPFMSLEALQIYGWEKVKSLPEQLQNLTALKHLKLWYFNGLESLPEWLGNLSSLLSLTIDSAERLKYLPTAETMHRLTSLMSVSITECPFLKERCKRGIGPEWHKISHIQTIIVDHKEIGSKDRRHVYRQIENEED